MQPATESHLGYTVKSSGTIKMIIDGIVQVQAEALFIKSNQVFLQK